MRAVLEGRCVIPGGGQRQQQSGSDPKLEGGGSVGKHANSRQQTRTASQAAYCAQLAVP